MRYHLRERTRLIRVQRTMRGACAISQQHGEHAPGASAGPRRGRGTVAACPCATRLSYSAIAHRIPSVAAASYGLAQRADRIQTGHRACPSDKVILIHRRPRYEYSNPLAPVSPVRSFPAQSGSLGPPSAPSDASSCAGPRANPQATTGCRLQQPATRLAPRDVGRRSGRRSLAGLEAHPRTGLRSSACGGGPILSLCLELLGRRLLSIPQPAPRAR